MIRSLVLPLGILAAPAAAHPGAHPHPHVATPWLAAALALVAVAALVALRQSRRPR
ncbi:hypothetical protein ROJ8625_00521 [Roseivivax jejudonensis]|uniref:Peptidase M23 n=1 Tax=Roseivivax jejudonensis TaxID=1529041 RepID=A0A1X6YBE9_9RHOB|nr:hypothetical protein [Roseivivax jejudonensis]SLN15885.1 hypothetical protein ROJ8625_00521 [Roseivivax jejudonensis]